MGRRVYFSFHYQDVIDFRANVVRNSSKFRNKGTDFRDASIWEEAKEKQVDKIKNLISSELRGTSVCVVLIGSETYNRRWVRYEIIKSFELKKGLLGVGINWIKGKDGKRKLLPGENPFDYLKIKLSKDGKEIFFFESNGWKWMPYRDLKSIPNKNHLDKKYAGKEFKLSGLYKRYSYDWNSGNHNLDKWIETAAKQANR